MIKELEKQDIDETAEILTTSYPWTMYKLKKEKVTKFLEKRLGEKKDYIAKNQDEIVGYIAIQGEVMFGNYIRWIVVKDTFRRRNIGAKLIDFIERKTLDMDLANVFLLCSTKNKNAIDFYEKMGYKRIGIINDFVDTGLDEILYWKSFGPLTKFNAYE